MSGTWSRSALVAEVYDLGLPVGYSNGDVEYYTRQLEGTGGLVLEPAVGSGRMLIPLLKAGLRVEGMDVSEEMLALCRRHCRDHGVEPTLHQGDMATFRRPGAYEAIILPAGSVWHLDGREGTLGALTSFHASLTPGGRLIADVSAPRRPAGLGPLRHWSRGPWVWTQQIVAREHDPLANRTTEFLRYEKWEDGVLARTELHRYVLQHWNLAEFEQLLTAAGFVDIVVTADYREENSPRPDSGDWTFQAVRG